MWFTMLRITSIQRDDGIAQLRVEGRVTYQTVEALWASCETGFADHQTLLLDLSGVQFVDAGGVVVFRRLVWRGTVLSGCSGFLIELLQMNVAGERAVPEPAQADVYT